MFLVPPASSLVAGLYLDAIAGELQVSAGLASLHSLGVLKTVEHPWTDVGEEPGGVTIDGAPPGHLRGTAGEQELAGLPEALDGAEHLDPRIGLLEGELSRVGGPHPAGRRIQDDRPGGRAISGCSVRRCRRPSPR